MGVSAFSISVGSPNGFATSKLTTAGDELVNWITFASGLCVDGTSADLTCCTVLVPLCAILCTSPLRKPFKSASTPFFLVATDALLSLPVGLLLRPILLPGGLLLRPFLLPVGLLRPLLRPLFGMLFSSECFDPLLAPAPEAGPDGALGPDEGLGPDDDLVPDDALGPSARRGADVAAVGKAFSAIVAVISSA